MFSKLNNIIATFCYDWFSIVCVSQRTDGNTSNALLDLFHCASVNLYMKTNVGKYDKPDLTFIQTTAVCYLQHFIHEIAYLSILKERRNLTYLLSLLLHRNVCGNNDVKQKAAFSLYTYMYFSTFKHPTKSYLIRHSVDFLSTAS